MKKNISVGIPVFNVEKYIERCLSSLFSQSIANKIEFIIVNDCSADNSMKIIENICDKYKELDINIISHEKNMGIAATRNTLLRNFHSDFFIMVDADDFVKPDFVEKMYKTALKDSSDIVICSSYRTDSENQLNKIDDSKCINRPVKIFRDNKDGIRYLLSENKNSAMWCKLVKKSIFDKNNLSFEENIDIGEDTLITAKLFYYTENISFIDEPLYYHFINPSSLTNSSYDRKGTELLKCCQKIEEFLNQLPEKNDFYNDILFLKLRIKRQLLEKTSNKNKYYQLYPETVSVAMKAKWIAPYMRLVLRYCVNYPFIANFIFSLKNLKKIIFKHL